MIIRGGSVVLKDTVEKKDILVENGKIVKIAIFLVGFYPDALILINHFKCLSIINPVFDATFPFQRQFIENQWFATVICR